MVAISGGNDLQLRDGTNLAELAHFDPRGPASYALAFSADGRLLATTTWGLAAWPWRELAGLR